MQKQNLLRLATRLGLALFLSLAAQPTIAEEHHHHDAYNLELQLNNGHKWQTDAPLRQAMGSIGLAVNAALDDIHHNTLNANAYATLASEINQQVAYMVENCELEPAADAQLHIVIARMLTSAQVMEEDNTLQAKNEAAVKLVETLGSYAAFFEDEGWVGFEH